MFASKQVVIHSWPLTSEMEGQQPAVRCIPSSLCTLQALALVQISVPAIDGQGRALEGRQCQKKKLSLPLHAPFRPAVAEGAPWRVIHHPPLCSHAPLKGAGLLAGTVDWTPHLPQLLTHIQWSFQVPVGGATAQSPIGGAVTHCNVGQLARAHTDSS